MNNYNIYFLNCSRYGAATKLSVHTSTSFRLIKENSSFLMLCLSVCKVAGVQDKRRGANPKHSPLSCCRQKQEKKEILLLGSRKKEKFLH